MALTRTFKSSIQLATTARQTRKQKAIESAKAIETRIELTNGPTNGCEVEGNPKNYVFVLSCRPDGEVEGGEETSKCFRQDQMAVQRFIFEAALLPFSCCYWCTKPDAQRNLCAFFFSARMHVVRRTRRRTKRRTTEPMNGWPFAAAAAAAAGWIVCAIVYGPAWSHKWFSSGE